MIKRMIDWGPILTGRKLGKEVRVEIIDELRNHKELILDFSKVESASHSFCDEAFGKIFLDIPADGVIKKLRFINITPSIKAAVRCVLAERMKNQAAKTERQESETKNLSLV